MSAGWRGDLIEMLVRGPPRSAMFMSVCGCVCLNVLLSHFDCELVCRLCGDVLVARVRHQKLKEIVLHQLVDWEQEGEERGEEKTG